MSSDGPSRSVKRPVTRVHSLSNRGLFAKLCELNRVDDFSHAPGDRRPFAFHFSQIVAVGLVRFDVNQIGPFESSQERRVGIANRAAKIAGDGFGPRAFEQPLHIGLHLTGQGGCGFVLGRARSVRGDDAFLRPVVEKVTNQREDQHRQPRPQEHPKQHSNRKPKLGQLDRNRLAPFELLGRGVVVADLVKRRTRLPVVARAEGAPLFFGRGQWIVGLVAELKLFGSESLADCFGRRRRHCAGLGDATVGRAGGRFGRRCRARHQQGGEPHERGEPPHEAILRASASASASAMRRS